MNQFLPPLSDVTRNARIAFIKAGWHADIVDNCHKAFLDELARSDIPADRVDTFTVPGAFEIPLQVKLLAESGQFDAIVASAFVVDGGIYRYEFVATAVVEALMKLQLETRVPVLSAVLSPHQFHEHETHHSFFQAHFIAKGHELASACVMTLCNIAYAKSLCKKNLES